MKLFLISLLLAATGVFIGSCDYVDGERIVRGEVSPLPETEKVEQLCAGIVLPEGSLRLKTEISSKWESGLVINTYSTELSCLTIDRVFYDQLSEKGWKPREARITGFYFFKTYSTFQSENLTIAVSCEDMKDFRGVRRFTTGCGWQK